MLVTTWGTLPHRRGANARCCALLLSTLTLVVMFSVAASALPSDPPKVSKVEPPNWWAGYDPAVMILLYGENLAGADVSVAYTGASVTKIQTQPDGKHAFVWLNLDPTAKPGNALPR